MLSFFAKKKPCILIVDDQEATRSMLAMLLEDDAYDVLQAADGQEAVRLAEERVPILVVLDINLPGMSGFEVLSLLKGNAKTKAAPVVMCTARESLDDVERCLEGGAADYIQKPFDMAGVRDKMRKLIARGGK